MLILGQKKVVLFPEIGRVIVFLSLFRPHSRICIRIYIFSFKKQQQNNNKNQESRKAKETKEEKRISLKNQLKNKFAAPRVKVFLVTAFPGISVFSFWPYVTYAFQSLHSIVAWMSRNSLLETGTILEV